MQFQDLVRTQVLLSLLAAIRILSRRRSKYSTANACQNLPPSSHGGEFVRKPLVSMITPCLNAEEWLDECFQSVIHQTFLKQHYAGALEVSLYDDGSTDGTWEKLVSWKNKFELHGVQVVLSKKSNLNDPSLQGLKGCGFGRNVCTRQSSGLLHFIFYFFSLTENICTNPLLAIVYLLNLLSREVPVFYGR